ncbi:MAG: hypothetical protein R3C11_12485 [Planctomycetaceae bacterium]
MIVRWPGKIKAGSRSSTLVTLPTSCPQLGKLAGEATPENLDGISFFFQP